MDPTALKHKVMTTAKKSVYVTAFGSRKTDYNIAAEIDEQEGT
jgi:hypothetical protein